MDEREKIAQLLCKQTGSNENRECESCPFNGCIAQRQADALIGANIGDVTEWKHRAKVAERALSRLCDETMRDIRIIMYPNIGKQVRDKQELYDHCIEQAEREIKEEEGE